MSWQYVGFYALLVVTSPPFWFGGGLFLAIGVAAGWHLGRRARREEVSAPQA